MRDRTDISDILTLTFQVTCVGQLLKFLRCFFFNSVSNQEENLLGAWWSPMACGEKSCSQRPTEKLLTFQNSREPAAYSLLRMLWPHDHYDANSWRAFSSLDFIFCSLGPLKQSVLQPNTFFQPARSARGPEGLRAESEGLLLADGAPTVGWGKIFWRVSQFL